MITQLDIYIEDTLNPKSLIIKDCSWYNPDINPTNGVIDIKYPTSNKYISIPTGINFTKIINSNTLQITNVNKFENLSDLLDGIWYAKYSICPNNELFVEYTFLRNTKQLIKFYNLYCSLQSEKCSRKNFKEDLKKINEIKDMIDASKYLAECGKYKKSIDLYNEIDELLNDVEENCNC